MTRFVAGVLVLILAIVSAASPASADSAGSACPASGFAGSTPVRSGQSPLLRPVVLVHGWTGKAMTDTAKMLSAALPNKISTFTFDYRTWAARWAANPNIAACLADYVNAVSGADMDAGGDGKVIVVTHSMGGLAMRYAMSSTVRHPLTARTVPYVLTFDTPYSGSPFGGADVLAAVPEIPAAIKHPFTLLEGSDGGLCLAAHLGVEPLPRVCGALPPYLPSGVTLIEMAGDVTIDREVFGVSMYKIPLASDGIVSVPSSHGYLTSGPSKTAPAGQVITHSLIDSCEIGTGALVQALTGVSFAVLAVTDYATLKDLQAGRFTPATATVLLAATAGASCSHVNITTEGAAIGQIANAMRPALIPSATALTRQYAALPDFGRGYAGTAKYLQVGGRDGLDKVNAALRTAALNDEKHNQTLADQNLAEFGIPAGATHGGEYVAEPVDAATSASSIVVSTLADMSFIFPDGNDGGYWSSTTVLVPSGKAITLATLFKEKKAGLRAIAAYSKHYFTTSGPACISKGLNDPDFGPISAEGLTPTDDNYAHWSLTRSGLRIGFDQGQFGAEACGKQQITIPWSNLRDQLSPTGNALIAGLR